MDIEAILKARGNEGSDTQKRYAGWLNKFFPRLESQSKEEVASILLDEKALIKMFSSQERGGVSKSLYYYVQAHILALAEFCGLKRESLNIPSRDTVLSALSVVTMYKDLDALMEFVDTVSRERHGKGKNPLNVKEVVILGWRGLSLEEAADLKKQEVVSDGEHCYVSSARRVKITQKEYNILKARASAQSEFLFTSARDSAKRIGANTLAAALANFNKTAANTNRAIVFRDLRKNAMFVEVRDEESLAGSDFEAATLRQKLREKTGCDEKTAFGFALEYVKWRDNIATK